MLAAFILFSMLVVASLGQEYGDASTFVCDACEHVMEIVKRHLISQDARHFVERDLVKLCRLIPAPELVGGVSLSYINVSMEYVARLGNGIDAHRNCVEMNMCRE
ncbi:uncharacterized protein DEA37_0006881 [Paragonimus westermani]|uniref:Saposin B-type domain-containing protein n=1 Tax=Paragonimus westermani TaxID=34504 RepID=A0A5J4NK79_9TREM|nr:uncharacterized protein DEA37_0006881 [Paragonimus westermani]